MRLPQQTVKIDFLKIAMLSVYYGCKNRKTTYNLVELAGLDKLPNKKTDFYV
jgi:hypothetical protein